MTKRDREENRENSCGREMVWPAIWLFIWTGGYAAVQALADWGGKMARLYFTAPLIANLEALLVTPLFLTGAGFLVSKIIVRCTGGSLLRFQGKKGVNLGLKAAAGIYFITVFPFCALCLWAFIRHMVYIRSGQPGSFSFSIDMGVFLNGLYMGLLQVYERFSICYGIFFLLGSAGYLTGK